MGLIRLGEQVDDAACLSANAWPHHARAREAGEAAQAGPRAQCGLGEVEVTGCLPDGLALVEDETDRAGLELIGGGPTRAQ
jgi:hypothetical protein